MCGLPTIDVEDLKANTEYSGYTRDSVQIRKSCPPLQHCAMLQAIIRDDKILPPCLICFDMGGVHRAQVGP
jgi:hypothetical protein